LATSALLDRALALDLDFETGALRHPRRVMPMPSSVIACSEGVEREERGTDEP
jgi:hypothetical protein